jgi:hypothetical protein
MAELLVRERIHRRVARIRDQHASQDGPPEALPSPPHAFRGAADLLVQAGPDEPPWTPNGFLGHFRFSNRSANRKVRYGLCPEALA